MQLIPQWTTSNRHTCSWKMIGRYIERGKLMSFVTKNGLCFILICVLFNNKLYKEFCSGAGQVSSAHLYILKYCSGIEFSMSDCPR